MAARSKRGIVALPSQSPSDSEGSWDDEVVSIFEDQMATAKMILYREGLESGGEPPDVSDDGDLYEPVIDRLPADTDLDEAEDGGAQLAGKKLLYVLYVS